MTEIKLFIMLILEGTVPYGCLLLAPVGAEKAGRIIFICVVHLVYLSP